MSYGCPAQAYTSRVKINSCSARELMDIPGVGRKIAEYICDMRESHGDVTPETFSGLGVRNLPAALAVIDFEPYMGRSNSAAPPYPGQQAPYGQSYGQNTSILGPQNTTHQSSYDMQQTMYNRPPPGQSMSTPAFAQSTVPPAMGNMQQGPAFAQSTVPQAMGNVHQGPGLSMNTPAFAQSTVPPAIGNVQNGYTHPPRHTQTTDQDTSQDWRWNQYRSPANHNQQPHVQVKTETEGAQRDDANDTGYRDYSRDRVNIPRKLSFSGKPDCDWPAFLSKFNACAERESWNTKTRQYVLSMLLEGAASKYYTNLIKRTPNLDYFEVLDKLAKRFDLQDLPATNQMLFNQASQTAKESLTEWGDRLSNLAMQAFVDWTDEQISGQVALRFCQGCLDKDAGFHAITKNPKTLEAALDAIKQFQQSSMAIYGRQRPQVRAMETPLEDDQEGSFAARATRFDRNDKNYRQQQGFQQSQNNPRRSPLEERVSSLETNMRSVQESLKHMETAFKSLESKLTLNASTKLAWERKQNPDAPAPTKQTSEQIKQDPTKRRFACWKCEEEGHIARNCPKRVRQTMAGEDEEEYYEEDDGWFDEEGAAMSLNMDGSG